MGKSQHSSLDLLAANTIRLLAADGVQQANSGHPGLPMGMADCAYILWTRFLKFNPEDPSWINRDRFVLSAGHGSMLLYSMLHLSGYDVSLDDLKSFRQWGSRTPGHPEVNCLPGVETTTGPLGQGVANAVGMAIAAKMLAARLNTDDDKIFGTHHIYGFAGDGDMMEGISAEAASLAGHLKLDNLILFYDDNGITIEGKTQIAFSEDARRRFNAYGWHTIKIDGHNHIEIEQALREAIADKDKPVLIQAATHIGFGSPNKQDTPGVHGAPLGVDELKLTKIKLGFDPEKQFYVPPEVRDIFARRAEQLKVEYDEWRERFSRWQQDNSALDELYHQMMNKTIPENLERELVSALPGESAATRSISGKIMQNIAGLVPGFVGGSADLEPSTKTFLKAYPTVQAGHFEGRNIHFGVREHAMGAVNNGMALYGGFIPYGGTFLVFSDYLRPAVRLAALMGQHNIFVFTHDSFFVGEDGPTHQPVEHLAALRLIPGLQVLRPADGLETAVCWAMALRYQDGPSALLLTRQKVTPVERRPDFKSESVTRGAYTVFKTEDNVIQVVILASGSEVNIAVSAAKALESKDYAVSVVSVPCKELFERQPEIYLREVIPESTIAIVVVEAGVNFGWKGYFRLPLLAITRDDFGASAPSSELQEQYGFTGERVAAKCEQFLNRL